MRRITLPILSMFFLMAAGCLPQESQTVLVPDNPFGPALPGQGAMPVQVAKPVGGAPSSLAMAVRVDSIGRQIVTANPQMGMRPLFHTIGSPQPEIFHQGTSSVVVTEGLAKQCTSDGQLAAVLSLELGKMLLEREALAGPQARQAGTLPPMEVRVGSDNAGSFGPADQLHRAELAKFEKERRQKAAAAPPDPQMLARSYLTKAGYSASELDVVAPVLQTAAENHDFAKQLLSAQPAPRP